MSDVDDDLEMMALVGGGDEPDMETMGNAGRRRDRPPPPRRKSPSTGGEAPVGTKVETINTEDTMRGVTVAFLSQVFHMDRAQVKRRLSTVTPMRRRKGGDVYDLATAAAHLVDPIIDPETFIKNMDAGDLPVKLTRAYWDARKARQTYLERAGQLYRKEDVMAMFAKVFKVQRDRMRLWVDSLDSIHELNDNQRQHIGLLVDGLQDEIYNEIKQMSLDQRTNASIDEEVENEPDN